MKQRLGRFLLAMFACLSIGLMVPKAQTVVECPEYCKKKNLQAEHGDDWHVWYFIYGCFLLPEGCTGVNNESCVASVTVRKVVR